jgi:hypothetical protein
MKPAIQVIKSMVPDPMTFRKYPVIEIGVLLNIVADTKKGGS